MDDALPAALANDLDGTFERLVLTHQDRLYTIALRVLANRPDAEEVVQDAFVRAYRALGTYERPRIEQLELRPWLARIVVNLCRNRVRRRHPVIVRIDGAEEGPARTLPTRDPRDNPHDSVVRRDAAVRWAGLVAKLPDRYRTPVVLRHVDGLSYGEMAQALDRPEGTLKAQVHRGLALLRTAAERAAELDREEMTA